MVRRLACFSREEGGWAHMKKGGEGRVVMVKTIIIRVKLSVGPSNTSVRLLPESQVLAHR